MKPRASRSFKGDGPGTLPGPASGPLARTVNLEDYFSSASMMRLKVSDGRMTAEVFSSSGQ